MAESQYQPTYLSKIMIADAVRLGLRIPNIHSLVELDITNARRHLREFRKQSGQKRSLTSYLVHACVQTINEDRSIQGMRDFRGGIRIYKNVDVFFPIENKAEDSPQLNSVIIRDTAELSMDEIHQRLSKAVREEIPKPDQRRTIFLRAPWFIKKWFYLIWMSIPKWRKNIFGTVYISSIMNFSIERKAWGIPIPWHSMGIFIGAISKQVVQTKDGFETRDMLQITLSVDHRVSNGGDMARFIQRLKENLENRNLLIDKT
jgi:pyruvate/2-oxoglutarate dehydrogenase complex dihydrolipoamide acyltransferase (E2) component